MTPEQHKLFDDHLHVVETAVRVNLQGTDRWKWPDLRSAALHGLWHATRTWKPDGGLNFKNYAHYRIYRAIGERFREVRCGSRKEAEKQKRHGVEVLRGELDELIQMNDPGASLEIQDEFARVMSLLPAREAHYLFQHFGHGVPYARMADNEGHSREYVRQVADRALRRIRERLGVREVADRKACA